MNRLLAKFSCAATLFLTMSVTGNSQVPIVPDSAQLNRPFGNADAADFLTPPDVYKPQTWFHYIGGNVSKEGITADLEAIAAAGISGIQLFHGQFGGPWPGVDNQITCLSEQWDDAVRHTANECRRLGLRFTMLVCPGWALAGGPWIKPRNAMRHLVYSRTDLHGGKTISTQLPKPQPTAEDWRDYREIAVIAFPDPEGNSNRLIPQKVKGNREDPWKELIDGTPGTSVFLPPASPDNPHWVEFSFEEPQKVRTLELSSVNGFNTHNCYEPGIGIKAEALMPDGTVREIRTLEVPPSNWQDESNLTLALSEVDGASAYRVCFSNRHVMGISTFKLLEESRKDNYEGEAAWTLRGLIRGDHPQQSSKAFVNPDSVIDLSTKVDDDGILSWDVPEGEWTVIRIGHVNAGMQNGPAPKEGTGWECDKFSDEGVDAQFEGYIGRLTREGGVLHGGLLDGMLMDSWECKTQTWTAGMEDEFERVSGYPLRKYFPALFGFVMKDHETTSRFLRDWRATTSDLTTNKFFGGMARNARKNGLTLSFETAFGDVFPGDIMEYYKYADVPMCEFWRHPWDGFVGSINFKPVRPTASAAHMYGKPRVSAESFTSFYLSWSEHFNDICETANINAIEGVTHNVFHTYTHNPLADSHFPGTSFGSNIGTPFLRGQTWWQHLGVLTDYLGRCTYLLERGKPVADVLWYLGDEFDQKPDQRYAFPDGYRYDYCNQDALLHRLGVKDGKIVTPEGISYGILWLPDIKRLMPETLEKIYELTRDGAVIAGDAPEGLASLNESANAQKRFDRAVKKIWGDGKTRVRKVGKGKVISGMDINGILKTAGIEPDMLGNGAKWLHRSIEGADWYFVCPQKGSEFNGIIDSRCSGTVEIWDPVTGEIHPARYESENGRTRIKISIPHSSARFVVIKKDGSTASAKPTYDKSGYTDSIDLVNEWSISFPQGWGAPEQIKVKELKPWKDLIDDAEGKTFSGTATYATSVNIPEIRPGYHYVLDLGRTDMIAKVWVNGREVRTLWMAPYETEVTEMLVKGNNELKIEVTGTWFNRLVYDAGQPEQSRKTWTISGPGAGSGLHDTGIMGPVSIKTYKRQ